MKRMTRVALITSGGDCQGLNAAIRGVGKALFEKIDNLDKAVAGAKNIAEGQDLAFYTKDNILSAMNELRAVADEIEVDMSEDFIPYPTYSDLLYSV